MIEQQLSKICLNHAFVKFPAHSIVPSRLSPSAVSRMKECKFIDDCGTSVSLPVGSYYVFFAALCNLKIYCFYWR